MHRIEKLKLSLREIADLTGESLPLIHDAINAGHLDTFLVGRRRFARPAAVSAWIDFLESRSKSGKPVSYRARGGEVAGAAA
ncbi:hypothetical protein J2X04_001330 [Lysobacter niabensis]|uniref:Helix-turn-helix domain-containing protein n=1 Tax=Agrilutibacter niabensis TaxID=380628 RepID=A0ABU1VPG0_9GAMM|nr:hypothetical protein [Lysobacter niabensis]MDR7098983.1 hypothetical protein [Lysobacter niabensis]